MSMFYIFKYGSATSTDQRQSICTELHKLQTETIVAVSPIIRADKSEAAFDKKLDAAMKELKNSHDHPARQNEIWRLQNKLGSYSCPAPSMTQLARLAAEI